MKIFSLIFILLLSSLGYSQEKYSKQDVLEFQNTLNQSFANPQTSPLTEEQLLQFTTLNFFEPNDKFFVKGKFVRTPNEVPFSMRTTTSREPLYVKYGEVYFTIDNKEFKLDLFKYLAQDKNQPQSKNNFNKLFLPFTDATSGDQTYGGGRFLELNYPDNEVIYIDFNKAYHPYCVYNSKYSCPIVPSQNHLEISILAGVRL